MSVTAGVPRSVPPIAVRPAGVPVPSVPPVARTQTERDVHIERPRAAPRPVTEAGVAAVGEGNGVEGPGEGRTGPAETVRPGPEAAVRAPSDVGVAQERSSIGRAPPAPAPVVVSASEPVSGAAPVGAPPVRRTAAEADAHVCPDRPPRDRIRAHGRESEPERLGAGRPGNEETRDKEESRRPEELQTGTERHGSGSGRNQGRGGPSGSVHRSPRERGSCPQKRDARGIPVSRAPEAESRCRHVAQCQLTPSGS